MYSVGIDIGGTFTDLIFIDSETGEREIGKILTTPKDPSIGAAEGLIQLLSATRKPIGSLANIIHGTTLVANALIERRGVKTGLITTKGFRDVLEIARENRYDIYDVFIEMPEPLVPRSLRKEVTERLDKSGKVLVKLDAAEAEKVAAELVQEGVESIAVVFLHSFRNPVHELEIRHIINKLTPETSISLSTEVIPEIREYHRTSTTVANAYTQPIMGKYLSGLTNELKKQGFGGNLFVMLSSGGITSVAAAAKYPIRVAESGPAAGAIAASFYSYLLGLNKVVSFDMGGTTAKTCLIKDGKPLTTTDFEVAKIYRFKKGSGLPIKLPVIEMIEIGAGGGSIARAAGMGLLKVGPQSAGADPGPACYLLGGEEPTVTDADLILGYLNPDYFLGGEMKLGLKEAREAIEQKIAKPLGIETLRAAWGIHQIVDENMANASRIHAIERGEDPKSYAMIAFGGAGPVHAYGVAERLGIKKVVCPLGAGVMSALGLLVAPISFDFVRTHMEKLSALDLGKISSIYAEMEADGLELLKSAGVKEKEVRFIRTCDMRYVGQGHEIVVPIPNGTLAEPDREIIKASFDTGYMKLYQRTNPTSEIEGLNWRALATGPKPFIKLEGDQSPGPKSITEALKGKRKVYFPEAGAYVDCPVYDRYKLWPGASFAGPAVVEERESTVVIGSSGKAGVDKYLNLIIDII